LQRPEYVRDKPKKNKPQIENTSYPPAQTYGLMSINASKF